MSESQCMYKVGVCGCVGLVIKFPQVILSLQVENQETPSRSCQQKQPMIL